MSFIENGYLFSNNQDVSGNNAAAVSSYVSSKNNAPTNKTAWGANQNAQIGGMTVCCVVMANNVNGGTVTPALYTHTANNLNAAGTLVATLPTIANASVPGTMVRTVLPHGTQRLKFLGMRYTTAGNVDVANVTCWMETGQGQVVD